MGKGQSYVRTLGCLASNALLLGALSGCSSASPESVPTYDADSIAQWRPSTPIDFPPPMPEADKIALRDQVLSEYRKQHAREGISVPDP